MNQVVIILQSETYAQKAKKILRQHKIPARVVTVTTRGVGCGRGIELYEEDFFKAIEVLNENEIEYQIS